MSKLDDDSMICMQVRPTNKWGMFYGATCRDYYIHGQIEKMCVNCKKVVGVLDE